ncbi:hypothetical protein CLIB1423_03S01288 [[Candida] railenensis]|uniref:BHLH domain-containing protein n=1 Tax=[Candida] railenensis TaxID=45579 RepID=A0A9P0VX83_9ASCO|nr:hypothetical protein CLIB1423_03S01288 [[Candida] railenensis]
MSFRINDYNAFLKSLYDRKGNQREDIEQRDMEFKEQGGEEENEQDSMRSSIGTGGVNLQQSSSIKNFPVDFDFGLFPPTTLDSPTEPIDMAEFALESSLPDQNFDLFSSIPKKPLFQQPQQQMQQSKRNPSQSQSQSHIQQQLMQNQAQESTLDSSQSMFSPMTSGVGELDTYYIKQEFDELEGSNIPTPPTRTWKSKSVAMSSREKYTPSASSFAANTMSPPLNSMSSRPRAKSSHNVIEQRYRNKINDRFTTLQNSVPTLRVISRRSSGRDDLEDGGEGDYEEDIGNSTGGDEGSDIDLEGLEPARKLSKGTILAKSVEYIKFLENKNSKLKLQQEELLSKARLLGLSIDEEDLCIS